MAELSRMAINQATTREQHSLREAVECYAAHEVRGISVWRDKLADCGLAEAQAILSAHGMHVTGLCRAGGFPQADAAGRRRAIEDTLSAIEDAAALNADCLIVVAGGLPDGSRDLPGAHAMVRDALGEVLPAARAAGLPLALEPLHPMYAADRCVVNTLAHALDLCDELGEGLGVAVDAYHLWWDPNLAAGIERAGSRVLAFHVCDWLVPTTDLLLDRGMMGDGVIDLKGMHAMVDATGYDGMIEVEIFSANNWWKRPGDEVVATAKQRLIDCV